MSRFEICWDGAIGNGSLRNAPLWKLVLKSDHLAALHISFLIPTTINKTDIQSVECLLLDKAFDRSNVEIHTHTDSSLVAPWLDDIHHNIRNVYKYCIKHYKEWRFSFEFDFKRLGIYHRLFHSRNNQNKLKFNFDANTVHQKEFIQECSVHHTLLDDWNWNQRSKKMDIIQKNEIIFKLKMAIPDLSARRTTGAFSGWMRGSRKIKQTRNNNDNSVNIKDDVLICKYSTNNVFIGFNSLMLYYEKIRTIVTDIFISQSDNYSIENSIIDILFKYVSFYDINTQNTKYCCSYNSGRMSLKKYGFNRCQQKYKKVSSFEMKNKLVTTHSSWQDESFYSRHWEFESCILKHTQLNVIFNKWMYVNTCKLFHNIIDKKTKKELIIPYFDNKYYDWFKNEYFAKNVQRLCYGHIYINFGYSLDKCIKNEWILNREYLIRCFGGLKNNYNYKRMLLNNGYSDKLKCCHSSTGNTGNQINERLCTDIMLKCSMHNQLDYQNIKTYKNRHMEMFYRHGASANKSTCKKTYVKSCRIRKAKFQHRKKYKKKKICKKYKKDEKYKHFELKQELNDFFRIQLSGV